MGPGFESQRAHQNVSDRRLRKSLATAQASAYVVVMRLLRLLAVAGLAATPSLALADDGKGTKTYDDLPGVDIDYRVARPAPEPLQAEVKDENGFITMGNTKVKISGLIRYDVDYVSGSRK